MKKILFIFLTFSFISIHLQATHNFAGEITLKQLDNKQYEVNLITYTIASSLPADRDSLEICWGDGICEWIPRDTFYFLDCNLKQNIYKKNHTYADEGDYIVSMTDPNRNEDIINISNSENVPFHIQTKHKVSSLWNHTPELLNAPTDFGSVGETYQHNTAAIDRDGDSLSYSLVIPMQGINTNIPNHTFPNTSSTFPNNIFIIHEEFGTITWNSLTLTGEYTIAILIREHRGGQILSETIRDMNIRVGPSNNNPPFSTVTTDEVSLSVGDIFNYTINGDEANGDNILMQSMGLPFLINEPANFSLDSVYLPTPLEGIFSWTITDAHVLLAPYNVVFRLESNSNDGCSVTNYEVLKININDSPTSILEKEKLPFQVYPNPVTQNQLHIQYPMREINFDSFFEIKNIYGQVLKHGSFSKGQRNLTIDLKELKSGSYFIYLKTANKIGVQPFIKIEEH